jgi:uncharacterized protein
MVKSTQPEAIEQFSLRVAEAWQIGRGKTDDGIVVVVAKDDRRMRIEVGYGLEGAVPDALAKRIIAEQMTPHFRDGDYAGGLNAGVDALAKLIDGEPLPPPAAQPAQDRGNRDNGGKSFESFFGLLFILVLFVAPVLRRIFGGLFGGLLFGGVAALIVWVVSKSLFLAVGIGFVAFMLTAAGIVGGPGRWSSGGGYWGGRGGFGGGFGGGGGGFSGGGGRFGGGGASGLVMRWTRHLAATHWTLSAAFEHDARAIERGCHFRPAASRLSISRSRRRSTRALPPRGAAT